MKRSRLVLPKPEYKNLCQKVMYRDNWKCRCCKRRSNLHCHHIIFRSHGGDDAEWNLLTMCNNCHDAVHDRFVVVLPVEEGAEINANGPVKFLYLAGWRPGRRVRVA